MSSLHHARIFRSLNEVDLIALKENLKVDSELEILESAALNMDEVRHLIASAQRKPVGFTKKTLLIVTNKFSVDAVQHALLKILEEPPTTTQFVFCLPDTLQLLPTVSSRVEEVRSIKDTDNSVLWNNFLSMNYAERIDYLAKGFTKKDTVWEGELFKALTTWLSSKEYQKLDLNTQARAQIAECLSYLTEPGASKKMLFEAISLLIPEKLLNNYQNRQ